MAKRYSVAVCESNRLFRAGLSSLLKEEKYRVYAAVSDLVELDLHPRAKPDELIFLLGRHEGANIDAASIERLHKANPKARIVLLVQTFSEEYRRQAEAAGAQGVLLRSVSREALVKSLELITMGGYVFSPLTEGKPVGPAADHIHAPNLAPQMLAEAEALRERGQATAGIVNGHAVPVLWTNGAPQHSAQSAAAVPVPPPPRRDELSEREMEILNCLVSGHPNKVIARNCNISEATVKVHLKAILRKIRVANRTQAAVWAMNRIRTDPAPLGQERPTPAEPRADARPRSAVTPHTDGPAQKEDASAEVKSPGGVACGAEDEDEADRRSPAAEYRRRQASLQILHHII